MESSCTEDNACSVRFILYTKENNLSIKQLE